VFFAIRRLVLGCLDMKVTHGVLNSFTPSETRHQSTPADRYSPIKGTTPESAEPKIMPSWERLPAWLRANRRHLWGEFMANTISGQLLHAFMIAGTLAIVGAWLIAAMYRKRMTALMLDATPSPDVAPAALTAPHAAALIRSAAPVEPDNWRRHEQAQVVAVARLCLISALMALSLAAIQLYQAGVTSPSLRQLLILGFVKGWPVVPTLGALWRWPRWQVIAGSAAYLLVGAVVLMTLSSSAQSIDEVFHMARNDAWPLLWMLVICIGGTTRAIAPWLILPLTIACIASLIGLAGLMTLESDFTTVYEWMQLVNSANQLMVFAVVMPWVLLWNPIMGTIKRIARAHAEQQLSDLIALFTVLWTLVAGSLALQRIAASTVVTGLALLLPLLWIPIGFGLSRRLTPQPQGGRPPTLLVLRVFQRDTAVQALFDKVVERWRLVGPAVMIAGTDLISRTLNLVDLVTFVTGRLRERMVRQPADVAARLSEFHWQPDADGRWRVNEFLCTDKTWQLGLEALVQTSDVVLMDLRDFHAKNMGCRHELQVLSRAPHLQRVLVLINDRTDRACATLETRAAPDGRFLWYDVGQDSAQTIRQRSLSALLGRGVEPREHAVAAA
jgi:hypothetical protein